MATTIGRVQFNATIDGRRTPKDAERIGREAGAAGADGFDETWSKGFDESLNRSGKEALARWRKNGREGGTAYQKELGNSLNHFLTNARRDIANLRARPGFLDDFAQGFENAGDATRDLQEKIVTMRREGDLTRVEFDNLRKTVTDWSDGQRDAAAAADRHNVALEKQRAHAEWNRDAIRKLSLEYRNMSVDVDRSTVSVKKSNMAWSDIPHNGRQAILITGAIAAGMQDISVLSSALGAGLFAVGGALGSLVIGGGGVVAVFSTLMKDIEDLPPELQGVATQFKGVGRELLNIRDTISASAIAEMPMTFGRISGSVRALTPAFSTLGTSVGKVFDDFSKGISEGSDGFNELRGMIRNATSDFPALAGAAGTWAVALMRGLNRANPMVDQLIGYIQELGDRFDAFTRSSGFDDWIQRSMGTFKVFGELLDATGRALNDLVTPEAVARTQQFMTSLADFMPNLSKMLDVVGRLDVFGIAAELLNQLGTALEPLAEPTGLLADALRDLTMDVMPILAEALGAVATLLAPVVTGFAGLVAAIPPEFVGVLAGVAAGILLLKGASGLAGLATQFGLSAAAAGKFQGVVSTTGTGIKGALGKAGMVGIAITGLYALGSALQDAVTPSIAEVTAKLKQLGSEMDVLALGGEKLGPSLGTMFEDVRTSAIDFGQDIGLVGDGVTGLAIDLEAMGGPLGGFLGFMDRMGVSMTPSIEKAQALGESFAALATSDMPQATDAFKQLIKQQNLSRSQAETLVANMGPYREMLIGMASDMGLPITNSNLLAIATGEITAASQGATSASVGNREELVLLGEQAGLTKEQVATLSDSIRNFGSATLDSREANRQFQDSLLNLNTTIGENGLTLDLNTVAGRANEAAIDDLAQSTLDRAAALVQETGDQGAATQAINDGRAALIEQMKQFGYTDAEAAAYVDQLGLIPPEVRTQTVLDGVQAALNQLAEITAPRTIPITMQITNGGAGLDWGGRDVTPFARGGEVFGATRALIGEAGPEAVVPLNRPLSQVDPSVRWLSAIAQGRNATQHMASGGLSGGGRSVVIEAGAIVVQGVQDPRQAAYEVTDLIAERIGS